jgi:hypothetical protein
LAAGARFGHLRIMSVEKIARVRIGLRHIAPEIWRRVEVPLGMSLKGLHDVIQAVMGWQDCHLFEFRIGDRLYGIPYPPEDYGRRVRLAQLAKLEKFVARGVARFDYLYDFGDDWGHEVEIEAVEPADPALRYPRFLDGARRGPPEDVGGPPGYEEFVKAVAKPRHPDHRRLMAWYGRPFDPEKIDLDMLHARLEEIADRRYAGIAAYRTRIGAR